MGKYSHVLLQGVNQGLQFRQGFFLAVFSGIIPALIAIYFWPAIFPPSAMDIGGYDPQQMTTYFLLAFALSGLAQYETDWQLWFSIRDGGISSVVLKPMNPWAYYVAQQIGKAIPLTLGFFAIVGLVSLVLGDRVIVFPNATHLSLFVLSVVIAAHLGAVMSVLRGLLAFWLHDFGPLGWLDRILISFLAGAYLPLGFFPHPLRILASLLPFNLVLYSPIQVFLSQGGYWSSVRIIMLQAGWLLVLMLMAGFIWRIGSRRYEASGG